MILSAATLRLLKPITPFCERGVIRGKSFGCSIAGYDIRIANQIILPGNSFELANSLECFSMPDDVIGIVHDKSSWLRRGLAVGNSVIECSWRGHLTLELKNNSEDAIVIDAGDPIAQVIFHRMDGPGVYEGKFQDQPAMPVPALHESITPRLTKIPQFLRLAQAGAKEIRVRGTLSRGAALLEGQFCCQQCSRLYWVVGNGKAVRRRPESFGRYCKSCAMKSQCQGRDNHNWKGGKIIGAGGYVYVKAPAEFRTSRSFYMPEHRLVMSKKLGRPLSGKEVVHHIDGNKANNAESNLRLFSSNSEHLKHGWFHLETQKLQTEINLLRAEISALKVPYEKSRHEQQTP